MEAFEHIYNKIEELGESHIYVNSYNDDYDNIVSFSYYDSGEQPTRVFGNEEIVEPTAFQILIRDTNFDNGFTRAKAIRDLFKIYKYQIIVIRAKSSILMLGNDDKNRSILTINFSMELIEGNTVT